MANVTDGSPACMQPQRSAASKPLAASSALSKAASTWPHALLRFLGTALLVTLIVGLVGALVLHATIIENQRDLDSQRSEIARIATQTESMRSKLAELEAPARIVTKTHGPSA